MDLNGKRILVTGGGGFIGSHVTEELVRRGAVVRCFLKYNSKGNLGNLVKIPKEIFDKLEIVRGDIRDLEDVKKALKNCEVIIHMAALISIPYSYENPRGYFETNALGTLNVLEAARENLGIKKIVVTSTSEVYGTGKYSPMDENHPLQAQSPYAASKIASDKIAESFFKSFNLPIAIIRPFNAYGPRQSLRAVIPTIVQQAVTTKTIKIGSLNPKRDFTFVEDVARGFVKVAESESSIGEIINIGSGNAISIGEVIEKVKQIMGKDFEIELDLEKIRPEKSEVKLLICDNKKAKDLLEWEQRVSIEEGLKEVINYIKKNLYDYNSEKDLK
ncbi:MAG: SDR family NAD(P)-dependent oxidoreductase [Candidatus ainarchaeum sp.]|nr:SDR family NAD(P)-dependent oxidoreductase [Candidatus ainarchaeum sp.]